MSKKEISFVTNITIKEIYTKGNNSLVSFSFFCKPLKKDIKGVKIIKNFLHGNAS